MWTNTTTWNWSHFQRIENPWIELLRKLNRVKTFLKSIDSEYTDKVTTTEWMKECVRRFSELFHFLREHVFATTNGDWFLKCIVCGKWEIVSAFEFFMWLRGAFLRCRTIFIGHIYVMSGKWLHFYWVGCDWCRR